MTTADIIQNPAVFDTDSATGLRQSAVDKGELYAKDKDVFRWETDALNTNYVYFGSPINWDKKLENQPIPNFKWDGRNRKMRCEGGLIIHEINDPVDILIRRFNGTYDEPVALSKGDSCGHISWQAFGGTSFDGAPPKNDQGWGAAIQAHCAEDATEYARGAHYVERTCPIGEKRARQRRILGSTGFTTLLGRNYEDGGSLQVNDDEVAHGKGQLTIVTTDTANGAILAIRSAADLKAGFDYRYTNATGDLSICQVSSDVPTKLMRFRASDGKVSIGSSDFFNVDSVNACVSLGSNAVGTWGLGIFGGRAISPSTSGVALRVGSATYNDTAAAGGANFAGTSFGNITLTCANTRTYNDATTVYIASAPVASGSPLPTLSNSWALWVDSGACRFDGDIYLNGSNLRTDTTTGMQIATSGTQKIGFYGATPIVRQVVPTGAGTTTDQVISALQSLGLFSQT